MPGFQDKKFNQSMNAQFVCGRFLCVVLLFSLNGCLSEELGKKPDLNPIRIGEVEVKFEIDEVLKAEGSTVIRKLVFTKGKESIAYGEKHAFGALYKDILSPEEEWVFLTRSPHGDFQFCKAGKLWECLNKPQEFFRVGLSDAKEAVHHRFVKWAGRTTVEVEFVAGGEREVWLLDFGTKTAVPKDPAMAAYNLKFE